MEKVTYSWRKREKCKTMISRQRYNFGFVLYTQDNIEGVSDLGLITVLLRGDNHNRFTHLMPQFELYLHMHLG